MTNPMRLVVLVASLVLPAVPSAFAGDIAAGERVYKRCVVCHSLESGKNAVGPSLHGLVGSTAGAAKGYRYSKFFRATGEAGLVWTEENVAAYLANPQEFLESFLEANGGKASGRTKMTFRLKKEVDARNLAAYLKALSE